MKNIFYMNEYDCIVDINACVENDSEIIKADFRFVAEDYPAQYGDEFEPEGLMDILVKSKSGLKVPLVGKYGGELEISKGQIRFEASERSIGGTHSLNKNFDHFFLDTFSVIENGEKKKREIADFKLGSVETTVLDILKNDPQLLHNFSPRAFEVAVAIILKDLGFDTVKLTRFSKDDGIDIYAIYVEGGTSQTVVVEVKQHKDNIGIEVVDRIFGVKARDDANKALLVTSSSVTRDVRRLYNAKTDQMGCLDFSNLTEFLGCNGTNWIKTPSDLWVTKNSIIKN
jgi:hypothetical protein